MTPSTRIQGKTVKGHRYIVVHAGTKDGFIKDANLIFKSGLKTGDYHDNMNRKNFENWFKTQLVPNRPPKSFIIMDNASYHSGLLEEIPRKSWTKQTDRTALLTEWLKKKNIGFPEKAIKVPDRSYATVCRGQSDQEVK
ncbi:uncharacterized protein LOC126744998 isoform X2 [Anthonomus grandis grandis]|uniref:uncharacterized protein LOC126744998 isoform X2 n=1 Tax=Anthonomus grandis grandis TaxID=2921223 RepID=UPI0021665361|nr:uncharacterized protein LOC126744998 isoform X2 [Anthonomus grandis grandis]